MREARTEDMGYWGAANRYVGDVTDGVLITTVIDAPKWLIDEAQLRSASE